MTVPATTPGVAAQPRPRRADPCVFVIFGAGGDLTRRLLVPALGNLAESGLLPDAFAVIGVARRELSDEQFRRTIADAERELAPNGPAAERIKELLPRLFHVHGDFEDPATYRRLKERLLEVDRALGIGGNCLLYLATPPNVFSLIARRLGEAGMAGEPDGTWRRIVVEKPFGTDLASARELNRQLLSVFSESQIYRIDHYLGKETVQNIMVLRFANGLFEPLWNRNHIDHVQITVAERLSVETRGRFYDATGALRDMVPNHLFQLLALTAMEPPTCFEADAVRTEKAKALEAIQPLRGESVATHVVRAQYAAGAIEGRAVPAYRESRGVASGSATETFVAMRLFIDNWRWAGVPFYLRTGKALAARRTEIAINFKNAPFALFRSTPVDRLARNWLVLRIQPDEGASLQFNAKIPGPSIWTEGVRMDFRYQDYFDAVPSTGYETLIYDCMIGEPTLFQRADSIELAWRVVQPILDAWRETHADLASYGAGSEGPDAAQRLVNAGHAWRSIA